MKCNSLLLERSGLPRSERVHDGKVVMLRSNLRWCSDGLEFACWNGDIIRAAFLIDAHDREVIAWRAVSGVGISGSDIRDMLLEAVERRFGACRVPEVIEVLLTMGAFTLRRKPGSSPANSASSPASRRLAARSPTVPRRFCENAEARLRPRHAAARRRHRSQVDWKLDRGLKRQPPALRPEMALASRVHQGQNRNRLTVR